MRTSLEPLRGGVKALLEKYRENPESAERMSAEDILKWVRPDVDDRRPDPQLSWVGAPTLRVEPPQALKEIPWNSWSSTFLPTSIEHVQKLVWYAKSNHLRVRTRGSRHSVTAGIEATPFRDLLLLLDGELTSTELLKAWSENGRRMALVKVGAGCHLGPDPADPRQREGETLTRWLSAKGFALPITGGVTHQTLAGFIQTGSDGGSLRHGFADAIEELELVDGEGKVQTLHRGTDRFCAAGVSMGLFGVITHVTLRVGENYWVEGREQNWELRDSWLARRPNGSYPLSDSLREHEYLHLNWFPQRGVQRVMQSQSRRVPVGDGQRVAYKAALRSDFHNFMAAAALELADDIGTIGRISRGFVPSDLHLNFIAFLLSKFVPLDGGQTFRDLWYLALPADDKARTRDILNVFFTEMSWPVGQTDQVLSILDDLLKDPEVAGNFAVELYGGKQSPFWLSPAHERDVIRVDPLFWAYNNDRPELFFGRYWERLLDVPGARFHWGKYLPNIGKRYGQTVFNLQYLRRVYPRMDQWLKLRKEMDPQGVFLNDYWKKLFQL